MIHGVIRHPSDGRFLKLKPGTCNAWVWTDSFHDSTVLGWHELKAMLGIGQLLPGILARNGVPGCSWLPTMPWHDTQNGSVSNDTRK